MQLPKFIDVYRGLISTSSISSTDPSWDEGNSQVIALLADWLKQLNFEVNVIEVEKGKCNLVARRGQGDGGLLLAGHTDTVPFDEGRWNYNPHALTEANNRFYGLGTADMKGFFAFIIEAVKGIDWQNRRSPFTFWLPVMKRPPCWVPAILLMMHQ